MTFAEAAFRAMLSLAPNAGRTCRASPISCEQGNREEELRAVATRLQELEGRNGPRGVGNGSGLGRPGEPLKGRGAARP